MTGGAAFENRHEGISTSGTFRPQSLRTEAATVSNWQMVSLGICIETEYSKLMTTVFWAFRPLSCWTKLQAHGVVASDEHPTVI